MKKYEHAFGKNDIRGIYNEDITEDLFYNTGRAFVKYLHKNSNKEIKEITVTVTRDARTHSPSLAQALIEGVCSTGAKVYDLGLAPTPVGYYSEAVMNEVTGALIVTASHNPKQYNGLKLTFNKQTLNETQIKEIKKLTLSNMTARTSNTPLRCEKLNIIPFYTEDMKKRFGEIGKGIKIVIDSANATGGVIAPKLYRDLGCEVIELFSEPDGNFPNHHPNPSDFKTLDIIRKTVVEEKADIGIAFDGDSDRIGIITSDGIPVTGDKLLLIYAQDIIKNNEHPTIVSEVKCSQVLFDTINNLGGHAVMCKTGHGYIKDKMKETNAVLAGEMSGHTFFKDRYYGFDDAVYAGCRIIEIIAMNKKLNPDFKISDLLKPFDAVCTSEEVRFPCPNEKKTDVFKKFKNCLETNMNLFDTDIKEIITIDGMRIVFDGGFALIRQSNTEPVFTLRFEGKTQKECRNFQSCMINTLEYCLKHS